MSAGLVRRGRALLSRRRVILALVCVLPGVLEGAVVALAGPAGGAALAPQADAVAPFGVFHDLRWLAVLPTSWTGLVLQGTGLLLARGLLTAATVAAAWPAGRRRPAPSRLVVRGVTSSVAAAALLAVPAALLYGLAVVPVSWLFLAAVPAALLVALLVNPIGVAGGWWRRPVPPRAVGWVAGDFAVTSLAAVALSPDPRALAVPVAAVAGLVNARAWAGVVRAVVDQPRRRLVLPVVPVGVAALAGVVVGGTLLGFGGARPPAAGPRAAPAASAGGTTGPRPAAPGGVHDAVLLVAGYGSSWDGGQVHPLPGIAPQVPFSYRGMEGGRPLPYGPAATVATLPRLAGRMATQVAALARRSGGPVDVVADSEGAAVAEAMLQRPGGAAHVRAVVLVSPLPDPGQATFPAGEAGGPGFAARAALDAVAGAFQGSAPIDLAPDSTFIRSLAAAGARRPMLCPVAGVRQVAVLALADAVADPPTAPGPGIPSVVVATFHGGHLTDPAVVSAVTAALRGEAVPAPGALAVAESAVRAAAAAWWVPTPGTARCAAPAAR